MTHIDPTPTEPIPVLPDTDAAAGAVESRRRAESVSMTAATLMARAGRAGASRSEAARAAPMGKPSEPASVGETRPGRTTTLDESNQPAALDQSHNSPANAAVPGDSTSARRLVRPPWQLIVATLLTVVAFVLIARSLTSGDGGGDGQLTFPIDGRKTAVIHIDSGADSIVVGTAELGDDLAVVTTPGGEDSGVRPEARLDGDQLRVSTDDIGAAKAGSPVQINVRLAADVRWDVVVGKGAKQILLALGSGEVNLVELRGGADLADITLPRPVGETAVRIPTGLATAVFHVPANVPVKTTFGSGAGRAVVDGTPQQGIASGTTIYGASGEEGYLAAKDRYLVDVLAGVGTLSLDRT